MQVYLITHAATEQQRGVDAVHWRLSAQGQAQANRLASAPWWHEVEQVVVSAEPKALLTVADVVAQRKLPVWVECRLDELRRGGWVQDYGERVAAVFAQADVEVDGWESARSALRRVRSAVEGLPLRFGDRVIAVVGHGLTLSLLRADLLGYSQVRMDEWARLGFGAVARVELPAGQIVQDFALETQPTRG